MKRPIARLACAFLCMLASAAAAAETPAETATRWGLIGEWATDCSLRPDRGAGARLIYEVSPAGRLIHRRDFGGGQGDRAEVFAAEIGDGDLLKLQVFFPALNQTREYGMARSPDGSVRAIYNRDLKGQYTIKDGRFVANGQTPSPQRPCSGRAGP